MSAICHFSSGSEKEEGLWPAGEVEGTKETEAPHAKEKHAKEKEMLPFEG